uniref:Ig-like domain-containing protein n=1 Tax=Maylandia zebra TaxID=106582 RepID=A0A3P9D9Y0_9CICH
MCNKGPPVRFAFVLVEQILQASPVHIDLIISMCFVLILPKPSISKRPAGDLTWGQDVSVTCSISTQHLGGTFTLQQTSGSFRKSQTSSTNSATFNIPQVTFSNEGSYQCQYQTRVSGREFRSPQSDSIRLSVTVILPKPSISMIPVGNVTWGQTVSITCSISTQHLGMSGVTCNGDDLPDEAGAVDLLGREAREVPTMLSAALTTRCHFFLQNPMQESYHTVMQLVRILSTVPLLQRKDRLLLLYHSGRWLTSPL